MAVNWNLYLARYQKARGGYYFGGRDWDCDSDLLLPQDDGHPLLVRVRQEYAGRSRSFSLYASTMVRLEHPYELHIRPRGASGNGVRFVAGLVGASMDFGYPEATRGRVITTNHRPFTKLVLGDLSLRNALSESDDMDLLVSPGPQPDGWHLIQVTPTAFSGTLTDDGPWVHDAMKSDALFLSDQEKEALFQAGSSHFNGKLDELLRSLLASRDAVTRWPISEYPS